ncbi:MAG: ChaN family lipoprotein [Planctomycetota bacterium]
MKAPSICLLAFLTSCATTKLGLEDLADELAQADVVFFGEEHDNGFGHRQHEMLLRLLHDRRSQIALSLEMFERDVQPFLDQYLADEIDEAEFLENSRPWKGYPEFYRPMVEYAKANGLPVIAANVPRPLATKVSKEGMDSVKGDPNVARESTAPRDRYWVDFQAAMGAHGGVDDETMYSFYEAQCLKDDTMAEAITDYMQEALRQGDRPMVIHVCGKFHSDAGLGTAARVQERMPGLKIEVLSMESSPNVVRNGDGDYVLMVPSEPELPAIEVEEVETDGEAAAATPMGRPALGFMPEYEVDIEGVMVSMTVAGGAAEEAGLQAGDIIVELDGNKIWDVETYMEVLGSLTIGKKTAVTIQRGGKPMELEVTVGSR